MKADILSRKEQVDTKEDNKDIQLLKEELWQRKTMAEVTVIKKKTAEENDILKEIKRNTTREKEVLQVLEKEDGLAWEKDGIVYINGRIYMLNNKKVQEMILKENYNEVNIEYLGQLCQDC